MKRLATLIVSLLMASTAFASGDQATNGFDANNQAEFSGSQQYTQNNYSNGDNYRINDVVCPVPTMFVGGNSSYSHYDGQDPQTFGVNVGVSIPLFTKRCEDAANAELKKMHWHLQDAQVVAARQAQQHKVDLMRICAGLMEKGYEMPDEYCQGVERVHTVSLKTDKLFAK